MCPVNSDDENEKIFVVPKSFFIRFKRYLCIAFVPLGFEGLNTLSDDDSPGVYALVYWSSYKRNFVIQIASRELSEFVSLLRWSRERIHRECGGMPVLYSCVSSSCSDSSSGSGNTQYEQKEVYRGWGDVCTVIISESVFISLTTRSVLLTSYPCILNSQFTPALL
jgi:hypothetical protein